jgi:energy-converting hydrogenase A subunit B
MLPDLLRILIAALVCWCLFIAVDVWFRLPQSGGVSGATAIGKEIEEAGGALQGGFMMGNIVSSPDASAGTLLASIGVFVAGIPGGLLAAALVYIGNRICADPGYAGTTGAVLATFVVYGFTQLGFLASDFIGGMVLAILSIQGLSHLHASRMLTTFWGWRS